MRNILISQGEYYHVFNRGVNKQVIFYDKNDWNRFLFLATLFQSPTNFKNISRFSKNFTESVQHRVLHTTLNTEKIVRDRYVELVAFCIMPNHFHLILKEEKEGGISQYMQRVLNSYTKYFNTKYQKSGHLFQGPYKAVHVESNDQLLYLSAYIHRNPRELKNWINKEEYYLYSSYMDFVNENRWGKLLCTDIIMEQFKNKKDYLGFVRTCSAKTLDGEFDVI